MGKLTGSYFENPYLEEGEHNPSVELVMDEARRKWRAGGWKPKEGSFDIDRRKIAEQGGRSAPAPSSDRFSLDIRRDLMGEGISLESLSELSYTPSYRPKGKLEKLDEATFVPMSTLQRYDVLAGELEAPPEDISFISDAQRKTSAKDAEKKDGKLRSDSRRLTESLDARRSEVLRMLPAADDDNTRDIIDESKRRKAREDKELGREVPDNSDAERYAQLAKLAKDGKKKRRAFLDGIDIGTDDDLDISVKAEGERLERLPQQDGMGAGTRELPQFESQTRYWSRIDSEKPTWSEVAENTVSSSPDDADSDHEPRYIEEDLFDERAPYKEILPPRRRLRSKDAGHYDTEYIREAGVDPDRVKEIMEKNYRGRWMPPEFFSDDNLVNEWFNQYNRGALSGEDYLHWAYRQKVMEQQQQQAEYERQQAERKPAYHRDSEGRRYPPFSRAEGGMLSERSASRERRPAEELGRLEQARRDGYRRGVEIDRLSREVDRVRARDERRGMRRGGRNDRDDYRYMAPEDIYGRYERARPDRRSRVDDRWSRSDDRRSRSDPYGRSDSYSRIDGYGHSDRYGRMDRYGRINDRYAYEQDRSRRDGREYDYLDGRYARPYDRGGRSYDRPGRADAAYPHGRKNW